MQVDRATASWWLENSLKGLPKESAVGAISDTNYWQISIDKSVVLRKVNEFAGPCEAHQVGCFDSSHSCTVPVTQECLFKLEDGKKQQKNQTVSHNQRPSFWQRRLHGHQGIPPDRERLQSFEAILRSSCLDVWRKNQCGFKRQLQPVWHCGRGAGFLANLFLKWKIILRK